MAYFVRKDNEMSYVDFLSDKSVTKTSEHITGYGISDMLYDFQRDIVLWALKIGKAAIFADCGLGKTPMQLEWARVVSEHTGHPVLIFAPLAVSKQTRREGEKFGVSVTVCESQEDVVKGVNITNYEKLHKFDLSVFSGLVLDESSILKSFSGKFRSAITEQSANITFKLACTATPAPNDYIELGNHAHFLSVCTSSEMLSRFFVNDLGNVGGWRLKGHAEEQFWKWVCSWAVMIRKPSDIGYDDNGFILPDLSIQQHTIKTGATLPGELFVVEARTLTERRAARRQTTEARCQTASNIAQDALSKGGKCLVWCDLNAESKMLSSMIDESIEVTGTDTDDHKEKNMLSFSEEDGVRCLVTKPKIAGFGMNWQRCSTVIFVGLSDSYEKYYQAVRRCWRFGQTQKVDVHIVTAEEEGAVIANIRRKESDAQKMAEGMVKSMSELSTAAVHGEVEKTEYQPNVSQWESWTLVNGDSCVELGTVDDGSIGYSVYSPPFADMYVYSDSERDLGNSKSYDEFFKHYHFIIGEMLRVTAPGRLTSVHCIDIPAMKERDGYIGLKDFPGDIIRAHVAAGWIYHSRVVIWKNPLIEAVRTKSIGLMHKQLCKDSAMCRQGLPDYVLTFRKPGSNKSPIAHGTGFKEFIGENEPEQVGIKYSHEVWRRYASPVWMDINQTRTLNVQQAREDRDEKHMCPLQLDTIERCIELWSNKGDTVLSPFAGIGSEGFCAIRLGRKYWGCELKPSYYNVAKSNLKSARTKQSTIFDLLDEE